MVKKVVLALLVFVLIIGAFAFVVQQYNPIVTAERPVASYNISYPIMADACDDHSGPVHPKVGWNS